MADTTLDNSELYKKYADWVYRKSFWYTHSVQDAQDLTHDIFTDIFKTSAKFENRSSEFTWIYRITINNCMTWLRKHYRNQQRASECDVESIVDQKVGFDKIYKMIDLKKLLSTIDTTTRTILFLSVVEGLTHDEVASLLKISRRAVCKRLTNLQKIMAPQKTGAL